MLIDVKHAVGKLSERNYNIIIAKFKYGQSDEAIAEMLEIEPKSVSMTVTRAVKEIMGLLNSSPGVSKTPRRVKSNAAARAELDHSW